jgi:hypothetical protein
MGLLFGLGTFTIAQSGLNFLMSLNPLQPTILNQQILKSKNILLVIWCETLVWAVPPVLLHTAKFHWRDCPEQFRERL